MKTRSFEIISLALITGTSAASWLIFGSHKMATGVIAGGLIGIINFKWLGSIVKGALMQRKRAGYTARYLLKFLFVATISALLIVSGFVDPLGFVIGFTLVIIIVSLRGTDLIRS